MLDSPVGLFVVLAFTWQETVAYLGLVWAVAAVLIVALICGWSPWR